MKTKIIAVIGLAFFMMMIEQANAGTSTNGLPSGDSITTHVTNKVSISYDCNKACSGISKTGDMFRLPFQDRMDFGTQVDGLRRGSDLFVMGIVKGRKASFGWFINCDYPLTVIGPHTDDWWVGLCLNFPFKKFK